MNHSTRDHRFAYISRGDITSWAKGTTRDKTPNVKTARHEFQPITSKEACVLHPVKARAHNPTSVIMHAGDKDSTVAAAVKAATKGFEAAEASFDISNKMNSILLGLNGGRAFFSK